MCRSSLSPPEAIETHQLVRSSKTIGILHGTYKWDPEVKNIFEILAKCCFILER
jgi:hypothetical protein